MLLALQPSAPDPRIGSWSLISAQASLDPPNRLSITHMQDGTHVAMTGETHLDFTASTNGHSSPAPGNLGFNQIELHRKSKSEAEVKEEKNGTLVATIREKISSGGKELTSTTSSNGQSDTVTVWERTGGAKVGGDVFAGEWTQDAGKSLMRQGLALKVEASGSGVHFSGEDAYTAAFDGKRYDVQHSRNDTVTLSLVDPHSVEATYRRNDQVTQQDHWVVSADGQQMTLTSTATLETGQHLTEKLVFKKQ